MNILDYFRQVDEISANEARKLLDSKEAQRMILLDVRQPQEYERGHLSGARFIPLAEILDRIGEIDSSKTVITYCARGNRSRSAAVLLKGQGFENVLSMEGGIEAWDGSVARGQYEQGLYLLDGRESMEELLSLAWDLEEGARSFYHSVGKIVNDDAKKVFNALIKAEEKHKKILFKSLELVMGSESAEEIFSRETLRGVMEGGVSVEGALAQLEKNGNHIEDIIEMSMQLEVNSLDFYMKVRQNLIQEDVRHAFDVLIDEEKAHLAWFGKLIGERISKKKIGV